ncbi:hypothetical protein BS78_K290300 [Paspalum vaginatum]|uniref:Uncharacterized protein n=1 Tax=Paspalum vaginatum TaxID=158149 RepID=A0A9W8CEE6_9POAL|nr:hypothetical protein BS78_K290300 [Paspalum vaginatum]
MRAAGLFPDALKPLRSYVSLPQATFGPKRSSLSWSTDVPGNHEAAPTGGANDPRQWLLLQFRSV